MTTSASVPTQQPHSLAVYFDHNATTPVHPEILNELPQVAQYFGNPSSIHWSSREPKRLIREARNKVAKALRANPLEIIFTSGASESNSTVFASFYALIKNQTRNEIITTKIEHPSVLRACENLLSQGITVHYISVNDSGNFDWDHFNKVLGPKTALVSVMLANNETGLILPVSEIAKATHIAGAWMHSDCVQAIGKMPIDLQDLEIDFASFSAHKIYALKGCGVLYVRKSSPLFPLIYGGGQERSRRGGTENTLAIWALGKSLEYESQYLAQYQEIQKIRDYFETQVCLKISDVSINHKNAPRLPHTSSLLINGIDGETMLMSLDLKGYAVSTGAACSSGNPEPSHVLLAMGLDRSKAQTSLRISFGIGNTVTEVDQFLIELQQSVARLRKIMNESFVEKNSVKEDLNFNL